MQTPPESVPPHGRQKKCKRQRFRERNLCVCGRPPKSSFFSDFGIRTGIGTGTATGTRTGTRPGLRDWDWDRDRDQDPARDTYHHKSSQTSSFEMICDDMCPGRHPQTTDHHKSSQTSRFEMICDDMGSRANLHRKNFLFWKIKTAMLVCEDHFGAIFDTQTLCTGI